ncbi:unnamed protein product [Linum tenue]|uniref:DNA damage-inducible protein 1 n=2 Tax=Linum tenue TaxID=586396 RepID=A0AAV0IU82_9ROSI|nr:unnamed protein product [Linum tenue]
MRITVMTSDEQISSLDVDPNETVENIKALLEVEVGMFIFSFYYYAADLYLLNGVSYLLFLIIILIYGQTQVPLQQQQLLYNGREIRNDEKLSVLGVKDDDLIMMVSKGQSPGSHVMGSRSNDPSENAAAFQEHVRRDPNLMSQLFQADPELAQLVLGNDLNRLQELLKLRQRQRSELHLQREAELALLEADPFDVEAQKKIEAAIRQKGIDENWAAALEYNPEAFARVVMLYVDMEVNGVPLKAFVDSGAQSTIISKSCAEKCGLLRLLDQRYKGIAHGVGQSEILGRIHVAPIKIGNIFYPCSFIVLESPNMEFLFGLDMLRKHQCIIDLKENVLRVGGGEVSVPFLQAAHWLVVTVSMTTNVSEKDIPSRFLDEERYSKEASSSGNPAVQAASNKKSDAPVVGSSSGPASGNVMQGPDFEAKVAKLVELGFGREAVIQALKLFGGNEEQAAGFLFGG